MKGKMLPDEGKGIKIMTAMSGGVDSTAAAFMLKNSGYEVTGGVMLLDDTREAVEKAKKAAKWLDIPLRVYDLRKEFGEYVRKYFADSYLSGKTPNPCVECNYKIKFGKLLDAAVSEGFEKIATGHYVKVIFNESTGRYEIRRAACGKRDQSYFLYRLSQEQLSRIIMPLSDVKDKEDIRKMLEKEGFEGFETKDSQDVCFIPDGNYAGFIEGFTGKKAAPGLFKDEEGNILGEHEGIIHYTIGQRKGVKTAFGRPLYVKSKDPITNTVIMAENESLFTKEMTVSDINYVSLEDIPGKESPVRATVKTRSVQKDVPCSVYKEEEYLKVIFDDPARAITPGQSAVLYDGERVLAGGYIFR